VLEAAKVRKPCTELNLGGRVDRECLQEVVAVEIEIATPRDMEIVRKEIFGPVIPVVKFEDLDQAIDFANDSDYGLTSSIYTGDLNTALRACQEIHFGETYINRENFEAMQGFHAGVRKSGIGGAGGKYGRYEFTQTRSLHAAGISHLNFQHDAAHRKAGGTL
jgi:acyl-CoA reductase-like NAD-dependent aldehyde dehydrogenase